MIVSALALIIGLAIVGYLRHIGHPAVIDRGEGQPRRWKDAHSRYHALGAGAIALVVAVADGPLAGFVVGWLVFLAVELAQRFPREGAGYFEGPDIGWNTLGAAIGAGLGAFISGRPLSAQASLAIPSDSAPLHWSVIAFWVFVVAIVVAAVWLIVRANRSDGKRAGDV